MLKFRIFHFLMSSVFLKEELEDVYSNELETKRIKIIEEGFKQLLKKQIARWKEKACTGKLPRGLKKKQSTQVKPGSESPMDT